MSRARRWKALAAVVCVLALTATAAAFSSGSSSGGSSSGSGSNGDTTGISGSTIKIGVAVVDLDDDCTIGRSQCNCRY